MIIAMDGIAERLKLALALGTTHMVDGPCRGPFPKMLDGSRFGWVRTEVLIPWPVVAISNQEF